MAYCPFCGSKIGENIKFCPECGGNLGNNQKNETDTFSDDDEKTVKVTHNANPAANPQAANPQADNPQTANSQAANPQPAPQRIPIPDQPAQSTYGSPANQGFNPYQQNYQPASGTSTVYTGQVIADKKKAEDKATASLVLGLIAALFPILCCCLAYIAAAVSVICGILAIVFGSQAKRLAGGNAPGKATAGIIFGIVGIVISVLLVAFLFIGMNSEKYQEYVEELKEKLEEMKESNE